jgi:hypothetical protein
MRYETGLILENAATNLEDYGILADSSNHGTYLTTGASFAVTTETTAPDGSYTASKLTLVGSNDRIDDNHNTFSNGQIYTYSVWLKGPADTAVAVALLTNTGANVEPNIRLTGEWQKVSVTKTFLATDGGTLVRTHGAIIRGAPGSAAFVTNGGGQVTWASYVYVWGMQIELGAVPTSTIPTYGGTATRAADVASSVAYTRDSDKAEIVREDELDFYNEDEGTLYYEASSNHPSADSGGGRLGFSYDGSNDDRWLVNINSTSYDAYIQANGQTSVNISGTAPGVGVMHKAAIAATSNDAAVYQNGSLEGTDSSVVMPKINQFRLYNPTSVDEFICGHFKKIAYYPERLSNAELQALTENN